ncbi:tRNA (N6-isopentenyl adenosine(37)-C2)-methylthiotransferase MiaB [Thermaerobacter sp. PB12/4term]|uniref:tRNA (N6-isopentenyl adenosine(37)-C2)-methylthiotransferase MiaB n=1 Tax=Thermaerobacter sp. PB12/4term TaxID=2293838 RepID=UPI000E32611B|nr:tRNA (N6-isopentenyl adenosine(37)-C2)-methylthiotransferase MiaB [Thermaerobacter sp. PB12/4term]QIA27018.1 tRNA (N6-isopentenyl adenosine(37)-C2)-methylthiotransferase MiaB [Thermaerobacter sp. PB12/4term]
METLPLIPRPGAAGTQDYRVLQAQWATRYGAYRDEQNVWRLADGRTLAESIFGKPHPAYKILTWGCQMNERDSEILAGQLEEMGMVPAGLLDDADLILLNTCAVRETAEEKVFGTIGYLKVLKQKNPDLILGLCGCMAQEEATIRRIQRYYPHVDLVFGTHNVHQLPQLIERVRREEGMVVDVWQAAEGVVEHLPSRRAGGVKAWVNIIYGCDKFCTFCIVPTTRGRERSRRPEDVIAEVEYLAAEGYKEVTLLGQNVNSYGKDLGIGFDFADLLARLDQVPGIRWIRYTTSHPRDFTDKLIRTIAESDKVTEHFHLPVQSGSNQVLRWMNRRYTREYYLRLIEKIREAVPDACITTDIIVGFPKETEEDFRQTLDLVRQVEYDNAFTFIYSPREGTPAARWPQLPREVKQERLERLMEVQYEINLRKNKRLVGQRAVVLIDGPSKKNPQVLSARTRTNKLVLVPGDAAWAGRFARVEITRAQTFTLEGRLLELLPDDAPEIGRHGQFSPYGAAAQGA